jgi:hypothetical protein
MNCLKNPRFKMRNQIKALNRALELNMSHLGILLYTANKFAAPYFSKPFCKEFCECYFEMIDEYADDSERRDYYIRNGLKRAPWLTAVEIRQIIDRIASKATDPLDVSIYNNPGFYIQFVRDMLFMFIVLHENAHVGRIRSERLINALLATDYPDPIKWLKGIGIELQTNDDSAFALIQGLNKTDKPIATEREILDARRDLAALKAYQDEEIEQAFNKACQGELIKG